MAHAGYFRFLFCPGSEREYPQKETINNQQA